jgi:hypothetical protein
MRKCQAGQGKVLPIPPSPVEIARAVNIEIGRYLLCGTMFDFLRSYNSPLRTGLVRTVRIGGGTESTMVCMFLVASRTAPLNSGTIRQGSQQLDSLVTSQCGKRHEAAFNQYALQEVSQPTWLMT